MFDFAIEVLGIVAHPIEVLLARTRIDDQQVVVFAQAMHNHVVNKRTFRIEKRRVMRLANGQPCGIVHGDVLHCVQGFRPGQANVAHVADVENADTGAH